MLGVFLLAGLIFIYPALSGSGVVKTPVAVGPVQQVNPHYGTQTVTYADGTSLSRNIINGPPMPPPGYGFERAAVSLPKPDKAMATSTLTVPAFNWVFGCSAVSGAMIAGYYDRNGYPNMYTGPTDGGVMPLNNGSWPTWMDRNGLVYPNLPLAASHNGVDGRATRGSIDDYWMNYDSTAADPYITGAWTQHAWSGAIGDYMKTSQSAPYSHKDGSTTFYNYVSSPDQLTCAYMETVGISTEDGTYGRKLFYEARGYTVTDCYSQKTDNKIAGGFSFAQFKAEIDAGRPVMLNLAGHTIVGVGYNDTGNTVYIHDTWDYLDHTMTWGTSYSGMELLSVSIVNLAAATDVVPTITGLSSTSALVGASAFTLTVTGSKFIESASVVRWNGVNRTTTFVSATQLTAAIPATDLTAAGVSPITVFNPAPGGGTSNAMDFTVNNPVPAIVSLSPSSAVSGSAAFTLTVTGTNFVNGSTVRWNGADHTTSFVSATQITAAIPAADVATAGSFNVTVYNATPGGGESNTSAFSVAVPVPASGGGGGGCFIATAAFGTPMEKHVSILREFRDRVLLTTSAGKAFVKFYYEVSPPIAGRIAQSEGLRFVTRCSLLPFVGMAYLMVNYGALTMLTFMLSFILLAGALIIMIRRKMTTVRE